MQHSQSSYIKLTHCFHLVADQLKEMRLEMNQLNHKNEDQDEEIRSLKKVISNLIR